MRAIPEAEYNLHLRSAKWKAIKRAFFLWCKLHKRYFCWFCGELDESLFQAHHIRYTHFGNERNEDLALTCDRCHTTLHNALQSRTSHETVIKPSLPRLILQGLLGELQAILAGILVGLFPIKKPHRKFR